MLLQINFMNFIFFIFKEFYRELTVMPETGCDFNFRLSSEISFENRGLNPAGFCIYLALATAISSLGFCK